MNGLVARSAGLSTTATPSRLSEAASNGPAEFAGRVAAARRAQTRWSDRSVGHRLNLVRSFRHQIVEKSQSLIDAIEYPSRKGAAETLAAELIPLADACVFLEKKAASILKPRRLGRRARPLWLSGVAVELHREPVGIMLIIGAANYPVFLPGVQALQALVAGNAVLVKPAMGASRAARVMVELLTAAGFDPDLVQVLPENHSTVASAVKEKVDKVVLTGSAATGRSVGQLLAPAGVPATMELSGCDAVFVLRAADLDLVARSVAFGLRFNGSATCIAPRRLFVLRELASEMEGRLCEILEAAEAGAPVPLTSETADLIRGAECQGARVVVGGIVEDDSSDAETQRTLAGPTVLSEADPAMKLLQSDVFAPVVSIVAVGSIDEALAANDCCPYALAATVFGPRREAVELARRISAGCVVINDMIAPTADPRIPFGGRKQSGFGITARCRGAGRVYPNQGDRSAA